jgi:hypothetical protein
MSMKRYRLSFADSIKHQPEHPERTARKSGSNMDFDVTFQVWPNRESMARSIRMQQRGAHRSYHWRPCVPLSDGEGY